MKRQFTVELNVTGALIALGIGAYCYASFNYQVDWYNLWCTGDMAALQLLNNEIYQECRESSRYQFLYQLGYIAFFGLMVLSILWAFLYSSKELDAEDLEETIPMKLVTKCPKCGFMILINWPPPEGVGNFSCGNCPEIIPIESIMN